MAAKKPFPLNAWYAAAWDVEIKHEVFPRTVAGKHIVMYRKSDGSVAALEDACWHRLLPLSKGRLDGDEVVCGYHGIAYKRHGRCTFMPYAGNNQSRRGGASFPSDRTASVRLGMDR